jgi:phage-related protein
MKPLVFIGASLADLRAFPEPARREVGHDLDRVQRGLDPRDWKPFKSVATGVREVRVRTGDGAFRAICIATFAEAVYVLHAFRKTGDRTAAHDVALAERRLRNL